MFPRSGRRPTCAPLQTRARVRPLRGNALTLVAAGEDVMTGSTVQPYRIEAPIGKGGMGEVFRAMDTRLGRTVALKFLPDSLASDPSHRARFFVEAQADARVSSPYVATLYDVGEHEGAIFLVMEYVEGEALS